MIELNWSIFIQMANFFILMFLLNIILYKPVLKVLEEREQRISEGQQKVKDLMEEGNKLVASYNEKLQQAKVEAMTAKNSARKEASDKGNEIIEEARKDAELAMQKVRIEIAAEIEKAKKELEPELAVMAGTIAEQVLERKIV